MLHFWKKINISNSFDENNEHCEMVMRNNSQRQMLISKGKGKVYREKGV